MTRQLFRFFKKSVIFKTVAKKKKHKKSQLKLIQLFPKQRLSVLSICINNFPNECFMMILYSQNLSKLLAYFGLLMVYINGHFWSIMTQLRFNISCGYNN